MVQDMPAGVRSIAEAAASRKAAEARREADREAAAREQHWAGLWAAVAKLVPEPVRKLIDPGNGHYVRQHDDFRSTTDGFTIPFLVPGEATGRVLYCTLVNRGEGWGFREDPDRGCEPWAVSVPGYVQPWTFGDLGEALLCLGGDDNH